MSASGELLGLFGFLLGFGGLGFNWILSNNYKGDSRMFPYKLKTFHLFCFCAPTQNKASK